VAGTRSGIGSLYDVGTDGFYWSSAVNGVGSHYLYVDSGNAYMSYYYRASGLSVRCLKD
jgi:hypothetical protein